MKRISLHIPSYLPGIMLCVMTLASACRTEDYFTADLAARHPTDNPTARCLLQLMEKQENSFQRLQEAASGKNLLYDYTSVSLTPDYGMYYVLPYRSESGAPIDGCIIYPVDENLPLQQRTLNGQLGTPLNLDSNMLNEEIPIERRFLYSTHFEEWENLGLPVEGSMTEIAHLLRKGVVEVENERISTSKKATRSVDDVGIYATIEFSYRAKKQDVNVEVLPDGTYLWTVTAYRNMYPIIRDAIEIVLSIHPLQIFTYSDKSTGEGCLSLSVNSLGPMSQSELVGLAMTITDMMLAKLTRAGYSSYISFQIKELGGILGGPSGENDGSDGGGSGGSGGVGEGDTTETPSHEGALIAAFMEKYLTTEVKNLIKSLLGIEWSDVILIVTDSKKLRGPSNAFYISNTNELVVRIDMIEERIAKKSWNDWDVVSILFHEYVHVKQAFVDGLVLARNGDGSIAMDEYKIYYGERDVQIALDVINDMIDVYDLGEDESSIQERHLKYQEYYGTYVQPIIDKVGRGEYYIVERNKDYIASDVEAYGIQLREFGNVMSPSLKETTQTNLDRKKQEYELIENAEKL